MTKKYSPLQGRGGRKPAPVRAAKLIVSLLLLLTASAASATHIIGGELGYQQISGLTYKVRLVLYGDCGGSAFSGLNQTRDVYLYNGNSYVQQLDAVPVPGTGINVTPVCAAMLNQTRCNGPAFSTPGVKKFVYETTVTLNGPSANWNFQFSEGNRSNSITNIANSGNTYIHLEARLNNAVAAGNNSVSYGNSIAPYYCVNSPVNYNPGVQDADGDSLVYQMVPALNAANAPVGYNSGFSAMAPVASSTPTLLNTANGQLSFTPNAQQISAVVYKVSEYRNGQLIGSTMKEMNFVILLCNNAAPNGAITAPVNGVVTSPYALRACKGGATSTLSFSIPGLDPQNDAVTMSASGLPTGAAFAVTGNGTAAPTGNFTWDLTSVPAGTYTFFVNYSDNACPLSAVQTQAYTLTVADKPAVSLSAAANPLCAGTSTLLTASGASSYQWTPAAGLSGTSGASATATPAASATYTVTGTSNGCSSEASISLNVLPLPTAPAAITGSSTACAGSSQSYSIAAVNGATSYNWSVLGMGWSGSSNTTSFTTTAGGGDAIVRVSASNQCGTSAITTLPVTLQGAPGSPSTISGPTSVCAGTTHTFSIVPVVGATSYNWVVPQGWTGTSTSNSITVTASNNYGFIGVSAVNACGTSLMQLMVVNVNKVPAQPAAISGNALVCAGSSQTYSVTPVAGATSYNWTLPGAGWSGASTTATAALTAGAASGTLAVSASNQCGTSPARTLAVTAMATPAQPGAISGNALICAGTAQAYSISPVAGASSYSWTLPQGWNGTANDTALTATAGSGSGTLSVTASNQCGTSPASTLALTAGSTPAQPGSISGAAAVCAGSAQTYSVAAVPGATSYSWVLPQGWAGTSVSNSISAVAGAAGTISVTASNNCGSSAPRTMSLTANAVVAPAVSLSVNPGTVICSGTPATFSAVATNGGSNPVYQWKKNNVNVGANSATYTDNALANGDVISVSMTSSLGCASAAAPAASLTMTVNPVAAPAVSIAASTPATICAGTSVTFTASPVDGGSAPVYQWKKNNVTVGGNSAVYTPAGLSNGDVISVVMTSNAACAGTATVASNNIAMTVNPVLTPALTISMNTAGPVCPGTPVQFSAVAANGGSNPQYQWQINGVNAGNGNPIFSTASWNAGDSIRAVLTSSEACVSAQTAVSNTVVMAAQTAVVPTVSISTPTGSQICSGTPVTFVATSTGGGLLPAYQWKRNGTGIGSGATFTTSGLSHGDVITVEMTSNMPCATVAAVTSNAITMDVTPSVIPGINVNVTPPHTMCEGSMRSFVANIAGGGTNPQYQWQLNGANVGSNTPVYNTDSLVNGDIVRCILTSNAVCAQPAVQGSNEVVAIVLPHTMPSVSISVSPNQNYVPGQAVTFMATITNAGPNPGLQWFRNNTPVPNATSATFTSSSLQSGDLVSLRVLSSDPCGPDAPVFSNKLSVAKPTGVGNTAEAASLKLYPNPNNGRFVLEGSAKAGQRQYVDVVNAVGQSIFHTELVPERDDWKLELSLSGELASGMYMLRVENENGRSQKPFVIKH